jgi:hypothetical protein
MWPDAAMLLCSSNARLSARRAAWLQPHSSTPAGTGGRRGLSGQRLSAAIAGPVSFGCELPGRRPMPAAGSRHSSLDPPKAMPLVTARASAQGRSPGPHTSRSLFLSHPRSPAPGGAPASAALRTDAGAPRGAAPAASARSADGRGLQAGPAGQGRACLMCYQGLVFAEAKPLE